MGQPRRESRGERKIILRGWGEVEEEVGVAEEEEEG